MNHSTDHNEQIGTSISLPIPIRDPDLFKHKATSDLLSFLSTHRFNEFSLRDLADRTDHSPQSARRAVDVLVANGLVDESRDGTRRLVRIDRRRLTVPEDPILRVPQPEYHQPVETAVTELRDSVDDVVGIVLYGSVARGEADRRSDIDLWVLTRSDRAEGQRAANAVARDLEDRRFDGDRYEYDVDVEAVEAVPTYAEDVRDIVLSGIPVYATSDFDLVENLLLEGSGKDG